MFAALVSGSDPWPKGTSKAVMKILRNVITEASVSIDLVLSISAVHKIDPSLPCMRQVHPSRRLVLSLALHQSVLKSKESQKGIVIFKCTFCTQGFTNSIPTRQLPHPNFQHSDGYNPGINADESRGSRCWKHDNKEYNKRRMSCQNLNVEVSHQEPST